MRGVVLYRLLPRNLKAHGANAIFSIYPVPLFSTTDVPRARLAKQPGTARSSLPPQRGFHHSARLVVRQINFRGIVHSEWREVYLRIEPMRQRQANFANLVEAPEDGFTHGVQRVLHRAALVFRERLEQRLLTPCHDGPYSISPPA